MIETKECSKCSEEKTLDNFYFRKDLNEYVHICNLCSANYRKERYENNKNQTLSYQKKYYEENKNIRLDYQKSYYDENKNAIKDQTKEYRKDNKEYFLEYNRHYYKENKEEIISKNTKYKKERRQNDQSFKLREDVSRMINLGIRKSGSSKNGASCLNYLSYSFQELKEHIEKQFEPWMTWNNWGIYNSETWNDNKSTTWTWQLDHIVPQSDLPYISM